MDKPKTTPKDFFLWAGAMIALYGGVFAFITLIFDYINYAIPNTALGNFSDAYQSASYEMATLIVFAPLFLVLMRLIRRDIARDPSRNEIWVRRWALYLVLFVAGLTMAVDLIVLINTFLSGGDLTAPFLLKVAIVLLVAAVGFMHFIADLGGYWKQYPERAQRVSWGVGILVVLTIASGFLIIGTPQHARDVRIDNERISDLQSIQSQIVYYYQQKQALPGNLADLNDAISGFSVPTDPQTGAQYEYQVLGPQGFDLCATFGTDSNDEDIETAGVPYGGSDTNDDWQHGSGHTCFIRHLDPQLYPPTSIPARD
jgi:uncharacterized membrane protein